MKEKIDFRNMLEEAEEIVANMEMVKFTEEQSKVAFSKCVKILNELEEQLNNRKFVLEKIPLNNKTIK